MKEVEKSGGGGEGRRRRRERRGKASWTHTLHITNGFSAGGQKRVRGNRTPDSCCLFSLYNFLSS